MKTLFRRALAILLLAFTTHFATAQTDTNSVLIVYDGAGDFGWYGNLHAKMLANLMGHFNLTPVIEPVESYTAGQVDQHRAVFYIGMVFDNPLPAAFTNDISTTTNTVCWIKNNLWKISGNVFFPKPIDSRIGFRVVTLDGLNPDFTINTNLDTAIAYKGELLTKNKLDPVLGLVELVDTNIATVPALAWRTNNTTTNTYSVPYIAHGDNFWYVSDSPFDYMSEEDRYIVFADLLHDIVKINHAESHTAIIRLEDIAPEVYQPGELTAATDYLKSNNVPFAMAVIPHYIDPLGYYNSGIPLEHRISDANDAVARVMLGEFRHAGTNGGQFIMHGYTHQYDATANPSTGVSADDFEFWRELFFTNSIDLEHYEPVVEDSVAWVSNRLFLGVQEMTTAGIPPIAWEPPHYAASELDYRMFSTNFNLTMMRALYFADDYTPTNRHIAGQFFPYPIAKDIYGNRIIGENLGNFEPDPLPPSVGRTSEQIVSAARKNLVIRDGTANAFFHGFYDQTNLHAIIEGVQALGYTYISLVPTGAPKIITQPVGVTNKTVGANFYISVGAVGAATLNYQWRLNGSSVASATNAVLEFNPAQTNQAGNYSCIVSNASGVVTSAIVNVDIGQVPAITAQPSSQTNVLGQPVTFTVTAIGSGPFSYQWAINSTNLIGETNSSLTIPATQLSMTGALFSVVVTNRYGASTSSNAQLTLHLPPVVTTPPASQFVILSNAVIFTVANLGDLPLTYQWKFNTNTSILNATNNSFTLASAKLANNGTFSVVLSNAYGNITSAPALLTVVTAPVFTNQPASQSVFAGSNATFAAGVIGSPVVTLQWRFNGANISSATNSALTITNVQLANLGDYTLVAANTFGSVTSSIATLTVNQPPTITNQPVSLQVSGGSNATFTVGITGTAPFAYQWRFNGTNLVGELTNSLTVTNVTAPNAGNYDVIITNVFGSVTSSVAALVVGFPPVITTNPASATIAQGSNANFNVAATGDAPLAFQWRFNGTNLLDATNTAFVVSNAIVGNAGNYDAVVSNPYGSVTSTVATLTVNAAPSITAAPVAQTNLVGSNVTFTVGVSGSAPFAYQWRFNGTNILGANTSSLLLTNLQLTNAGNYSVVVSNNFGSVTSAVAALTVLSPPIITVQPVTVTNLVGTTATVSVTAIGSPTLHYQWYRNGNLVTNGIGVSIVLNNVVPASGANFFCVITNNYGSVTSSTAAIVIVSPPAVTNQPASRTNVAGSTATFSVTATGTAPFTYQWRFNGTNLSGENTNSLSVTNVQFANGGKYDVVVSNAYAGTTSAVAVLTVSAPPSITASPTAQNIGVNSNATFTVGVDGTAPLAFQWRFNGTDISGATTNPFTLPGVLTNNAGNYDVVVTNSFGAVTSAPAALTVSFPPSITNQPIALGVTVTSNATFSVGVDGTAPFTFQWRVNGTNILNANTNTLTLTNSQPADTGSYDVIVQNPFGSVTSSVAALTVNFPPSITNQPASLAVLASSNATFTIGVSGTSPLAFQWRFNGSGILGATASSLTVSNVNQASVGNYDVIVTNNFGALTSSIAALTVDFPPTITNQPAALAVMATSNATFTVGVSGTAPFTYQWRLNGTNLAATTSTLAITAASAADAGNYDVIVQNAFGSVTSSIAALTVNFPPAITAQPTPQAALVTSNATFTVTATGTATLTYQWRLNGAPISGANTFSLTVSNVSQLNVGNYDVIVTNNFGAITSSTAALTVNFPPTITNQPVAQSVVVSNAATFSVLSSGSEPQNYQWWLNITNLVAGGTNSTLTIPSALASDAGNYSVVVSNPYGSVTSAPAALTVHFPARITGQPASLGVVATSNGTFTVTADGDAPLAFQWNFNGTNLSGANASSLTVSNVSLADQGNYFVTISNSYGSATSSVATLTVNFVPVITNQPASATITTGSNVSLTVGVTGSAPFSYQWLRNGTNVVTDATNAILNFANAQTNDSGVYSVVVNNSYGATTSSVAALTVYQPIGISSSPASQTNLVGSNVTFSVGVTGTSPFVYQWRFNTTNLVGATNSSLTVSNVQFTNAGSYDVIAANPFGATNSAQATLTVVAPPAITTQPLSRTNLVGTTANFVVAANGTGPLAYQWYRNGNVITNANGTQITLSNVVPAAAANFFVIITNNSGAVTSATVALTIVSPPAITNQPISRTNNAGTTATFSVVVTGTAPFGYQWRFNGTNILGANSNILSVANAQSTNAGSYDVIITNAYAAVTSSIATLAINVAPTITTPPASRTNILGSTATFTVGATGSPAPAYQWKFNTVNIPGATNATLTITNVAATNAGNYTVLAANLLGSTLSSVATLTVVSAAPPVLTLAPGAGNTVTLAFSSTTSQSYTVEYLDTLGSTNWLALTNVIGTGTTLEIPLAMPTEARFFRLRTP